MSPLVDAVDLSAEAEGDGTKYELISQSFNYTGQKAYLNFSLDAILSSEHAYVARLR